jgi:uncharacterized membrane protein
MSSLLIFTFSSQNGASQMIADLLSLQKKQFISISDAAVIIRKPDGMIKIKKARELVGTGTLGDAFWGVLVGMVFLMPWQGMASGSGSVGLAGKSADYGISNSFIKEVGATILPGYSALFLIVSRLTEDEVIKVLSSHKATFIRTDLSDADEIKLRETFGSPDLEG